MPYKTSTHGYKHLYKYQIHPQTYKVPIGQIYTLNKYPLHEYRHTLKQVQINTYTPSGKHPDRYTSTKKTLEE